LNELLLAQTESNNQQLRERDAIIEQLMTTTHEQELAMRQLDARFAEDFKRP
jgi:uncharacterized protein YukE